MKEAIRGAIEVLKICKRTGLRFYEPGANIVLGEVYLENGDKVKVCNQLEKAVKCRQEISDPNAVETEKLLKRLKN